MPSHLNPADYASWDFWRKLLLITFIGCDPQFLFEDQYTCSSSSLLSGSYSGYLETYQSCVIAVPSASYTYPSAWSRLVRVFSLFVRWLKSQSGTELSPLALRKLAITYISQYIQGCFSAKSQDTVAGYVTHFGIQQLASFPMSFGFIRCRSQINNDMPTHHVIRSFHCTVCAQAKSHSLYF